MSVEFNANERRILGIPFDEDVSKDPAAATTLMKLTDEQLQEIAREYSLLSSGEAKNLSGMASELLLLRAECGAARETFNALIELGIGIEFSEIYTAAVAATDAAGFAP